MNVVIVGASSGIGLELARLYIARGYRVALAARRLELLEPLRALAPNKVEIARIDVTDTDATLQIEALVERIDGMDVYIHSAGIGWQNVDLEADVEVRTIAVNVDGFTRCMDYAFSYFASRGKGHLVAISSVAGTRGLGSAPAYSSSKAYQATYLQCLRQLCSIRHLKGITITDIRPGFVDTALLSGGKYPMLMRVDYAARHILRAIDGHKSVRIVDWRYRILVGLWRLIPRFLWERLPIW